MYNTGIKHFHTSPRACFSSDGGLYDSCGGDWIEQVSGCGNDGDGRGYHVSGSYN